MTSLHRAIEFLRSTFTPRKSPSDITPEHWLFLEDVFLEKAMTAYMAKRPLTPDQISAIRGYLSQWISAPCWPRDYRITRLRQWIPALSSREAIERWIEQAEEVGIDPR